VNVVADTLPLNDIGPVVLASVNTFTPLNEVKFALPDPEFIVRLLLAPVIAASVIVPDPPPLLIVIGGTAGAPSVIGAAKVILLVPDVVTFADRETVPAAFD
jgi:hypothetical protein